MQHVLITVEVGLLSGKSATVEADLDEETSGSARTWSRKRVRADASGSILDARESIKRARLQDRCSLTVRMNRVQVEATGWAFAAILGDGSVVTWGDARHGRDSSAVQDQLKNVQPQMP